MIKNYNTEAKKKKGIQSKEEQYESSINIKKGKYIKSLSIVQAYHTSTTVYQHLVVLSNDMSSADICYIQYSVMDPHTYIHTHSGVLQSGFTLWIGFVLTGTVHT